MRSAMGRATGRGNSSPGWREPATAFTAVLGQRQRMPPELLGFAGATLDREANHRSDLEWLAARRADPGARLIRLNGDKVALNGGTIAHEAVSDAVPAIFLGLDDRGAPIFAAEATEPIQGGVDLRSIATQSLLPPAELALLAQARSLIHWHQRHRFCANCGVETVAA